MMVEAFLNERNIKIAQTERTRKAQTMGRLPTGIESHHCCQLIGALAVILVAGTAVVAANSAPQHRLVGKRFAPADVDYDHPIYESSFEGQAALGDWRLEGGKRMSIAKGNLVLESRPTLDDRNHLVCWLAREVPADFLLEFTVRPQDRKTGLNIVFFNARGVKGESIFDPTLQERNGVFKQYHSGDLDSYHVSYWAGDRGFSNLRKNHGFHLVSSGKDYIMVGEPNAFQTVRIYKRAGKIRVTVDGLVATAFDDDGKTFGPVHNHSGWIGLRQMGHTRRCEYGHVKIYGLLSTTHAGLPEAIEIPIWSGIAPGSAGSTLNEEYRDRPITDGTRVIRDRSVRGVTRPTLTVYLSTLRQATAAAVVICPGGGFSHLAIDKEGHDVARWLQTHGIAGAVVKYRLPDPDVGLYVPNGSIPDMQRAIRIVRFNAGKWNIDPVRIGVMGFSAGGYMAAAAGTLFDDDNPGVNDPIRRVSCRPDFIVPVYPLISLELQGSQPAGLLERMLGRDLNDELIRTYSLETRVTSQTPPVFLVHAHDDGLSVEHSIRFYLASRKAKVPAELHVYSKGGHGFGMRQRGRPVSAWRERWLEWMEAEGFLQQSERP
jgi:acetyl esterase/lipase